MVIARVVAISVVIFVAILSFVAAADVDAHFGLTGGMSLVTVVPGDNIYVTLQGRPSAGFYWILNQTTPGFSHLQLTNSTHTDIPPVSFACRFLSSCFFLSSACCSLG
jgi:hypothetical protein